MREHPSANKIIDRFKSLKPKGIDTMATTKMTNKVAYEMAITALSASNLPNKDEAIAKIAKAIEQLEKKSAGSGKPTKTQLANMALAEGIAEFMANQPNRLFSISEISKECPAVLGENPQKIRPLLTTLIQQKRVERTEVKGKPMFQFVGEVED